VTSTVCSTGAPVIQHWRARRGVRYGYDYII
jgi:hypothetical protein